MNNEDIYNNYFKDLIDNNEEGSQLIVRDNNKKVFKDDGARIHVKESSIGTDHEISYYNKADGNISNIYELANIIKQLCNAAWGQDWGELSLDIKKGENSANIKMPQILMDTNTRDVSEVLGNVKPILFDTQEELDENGNPTGDSFLLYRQWFDSNIEFDIFAENSKECRELSEKLETLLLIYSGYLKRKGLSEIFFLREISPKSSLNFSENVSMRCILYYVRFESITAVRVSTINSINTQIGAGKVNTSEVKTLLKESNNRDFIELDFFDGDNEITMNK